MTRLACSEAPAIATVRLLVWYDAAADLSYVLDVEGRIGEDDAARIVSELGGDAAHIIDDRGSRAARGRPAGAWPPPAGGIWWFAGHEVTDTDEDGAWWLEGIWSPATLADLYRAAVATGFGTFGRATERRETR